MFKVHVGTCRGRCDESSSPDMRRHDILDVGRHSKGTELLSCTMAASLLLSLVIMNSSGQQLVVSCASLGHEILGHPFPWGKFHLVRKEMAEGDQGWPGAGSVSFHLQNAVQVGQGWLIEAVETLRQLIAAVLKAVWPFACVVIHHHLQSQACVSVSTQAMSLVAETHRLVVVLVLDEILCISRS